MTEEQDKQVETNQRITRLETRMDAMLPFLATKIDLEQLRLSLQESIKASEDRLTEQFTQAFYRLDARIDKLGDRLEQVADRTHDEMMRLMRWGTGVCVAMALAIGGVYATVLFR